MLVAYASKTGFTKGIAEYIAEKIRETGIDTVALEVDHVDNPNHYDAYVIGSASYMWKWMKEARQFVERNHKTLSEHPVWLFSSGPIGTDKVDKKGRDVLETSVPKDIAEFKKIISPRDHKVFYGGLDPSKLTGAIAFGYKMATLSKSAKESMPVGDFRNWDEIGAWAKNIADELQTSIKQ